MKSSIVTNVFDFNYVIRIDLADLPVDSWVTIYPQSGSFTRGIVVEKAVIILHTAFNSGTSGAATLRHSGGVTLAELGDIKDAVPGEDGYAYARVDSLIDGASETLQMQRVETGSAATTGRILVFLKRFNLNDLSKTV